MHFTSTSHLFLSFPLYFFCFDVFLQNIFSVKSLPNSFEHFISPCNCMASRLLFNYKRRRKDMGSEISCFILFSRSSSSIDLVAQKISSFVKLFNPEEPFHLAFLWQKIFFLNCQKYFTWWRRRRWTENFYSGLCVFMPERMRIPGRRTFFIFLSI